MSKSLSEVEQKTHVAEVVHHGEKLLLPQGMSIDDAIQLLERRRDYLEESVLIRKTFNVFPWDGANALAEVLIRKFGWAAAETQKSFFGDQPPQMLTIDVGPGQTREVPWGKFSIPHVSGHLFTGVQQQDGRLCFELVAKIKRQDEAVVRALLHEVEEYLKENSIYAGKAIKIRFRDDNGDKLDMPVPKFMETDNISKDMLICSREVQDSIETNLFTPIQRVQDCLDNGIDVKRGVLLGGPYGTGKTLAASVASRLAVDAGVTYIYVPRSDELSDAIEFAKQYQTTACVVFCEDIDRAMSGERSVKMDDILNILDGIDTKSSHIITVLTTNYLENVNPAMLRPGRLDAIITVTPPDAEAVDKLLRHYGDGTITADEDLSAASEVLAGTIPAVIAEVVKRAKLVQLRLQEPGTMVTSISGQAVYEAALTMQSQVDLLEAQSKPKQGEPTFKEVMGEALASGMNGTKESIARIQKEVNDIRNHVC